MRATESKALVTSRIPPIAARHGQKRSLCCSAAFERKAAEVERVAGLRTGRELSASSACPPDDAQRPADVAGAHKERVGHQEGRLDEHLRPARRQVVEIKVV